MKYYLIAGEASGDLHASNLMASLKKEDPNAEFRFFGGDLMHKQGGTLVRHYRELAFMGFIPVLLNLRTVLRNISSCKEDILSYQPDVVILVDYPGFNMKIAEFVKTRTDIPVYYYISPKIWAWKEYRIKGIKKFIDKMYSILPFEVDFYKKHGYKVEYVGNPSVDELAHLPQKEEFADFVKRNGLLNKPLVALLPGSRKQELNSNLSIMLEAVKEFHEYQFVIAGAPGLTAEHYSRFTSNKNVSVVFGETYAILQQAKAAIVTSGTATLETALLGVPQVVCYYVWGPKPLYKIVRSFIKVKWISLVNIISNREVCRELVGYMVTPDNVKEELERLLKDQDYRSAMLSNYKRMQTILGDSGAASRAANAMVKELNSQLKC